MRYVTKKFVCLGFVGVRVFFMGSLNNNYLIQNIAIFRGVLNSVKKSINRMDKGHSILDEHTRNNLRRYTTSS